MEEGKQETKPNITTINLKDGIARYYIDTYEKLYWIVNERFKFQNQNGSGEEPIIDFSRLVICIKKGLMLSAFSIGTLCGKIKGITYLGYGNDYLSDWRDFTLLTREIKFQVKYKVTFEFSIIYEVNFADTKFLDDVNFYGTQLVAFSNFSNSLFNKKVTLISVKCKEKNKSKNDIPLNVFNYNLFLNYINEENSNIYVKNIISFSDSIFDDDVCFNSIEDFINEEDNLHFENNFDLLSNIFINGSHFNKNLKINNVAIGKISMQNCHFDGTVNISRNKYNASSSIDFALSTIKSLFIIDSDLGERKGEIIKLSKQFSFSKSLITKDAFILIRNINSDKSNLRAGTLDFRYANILGTVTIQDSKLDSVKLDKSTIIGHINIENVETDYDSRESIAKIKNEYFQRNDIVNLLFYKAKEMKYYSEHLDFKNKFITNIFRWFTRNWFYNTIGICFLPILLLLSLLPIKSLEKVREYTLLYLNRISNSFGMSWGQGVLFTCVTAWLFFALINTWGVKSTPLFVWGWNGSESFGEVWKYYLHMFYLIDFKDKFNDIIKDGIIKHEGIKLNALGDTLFFVSKIFVSYGIYQTISAFRKYGK